MNPFISALFAVIWIAIVAHPAAAQISLHERIDALIGAEATDRPNAPALDAEFVRRVYLDLAGRIPTGAEAQAFCGDAAPGKRQELIDRLLASAEHPIHLAEAFDVMLMERLGDHAEWQTWLLDSFKSNKPWDLMTREMLAPHLPDDPARGAGLFLSKRLEHYGENPVEYPALVRDVGRLFLGVDLQCAQCHDHPQIDDYKQIDFQGLYAFFANVSLLDGAKYPAVTERPITKKVDFQSVFLLEKRDVAPRLPFGAEIAIPVPAEAGEFQVSPDKATGSPGLLKFSALQTLSSELPRRETTGFAKNIANRLWWLMLGRGQVNPLDQHHAANAPSHPELLELLGKELAVHNFDMRWLLREIALSETYQRSSAMAEGAPAASLANYCTGPEKPLSPEQLARSLLTATGPWNDEKKLPDLTEQCVKALAQPPREPETGFAPSVKGALFVSHGSAVLGLLQPQDGNLMDRVLKLESADQAANELYMSVFSRAPSEEERLEFTTYLVKHSALRTNAISQYLWAMLGSNEFALNH